jgi:hypothetical protein
VAQAVYFSTFTLLRKPLHFPVPPDKNEGTRNHNSDGELKSQSTSTSTTAAVSSPFAISQLHPCLATKQCRAKRYTRPAQNKIIEGQVNEWYSSAQGDTAPWKKKT